MNFNTERNCVSCAFTPNTLHLCLMSVPLGPCDMQVWLYTSIYFYSVTSILNDFQAAGWTGAHLWSDLRAGRKLRSWRKAARTALAPGNFPSWRVRPLLPSPTQDERTGSTLKWPQGSARSLLWGAPSPSPGNPRRVCSLGEKGHLFLLTLGCWLAGEAFPRLKANSNKECPTSRPPSQNLPPTPGSLQPASLPRPLIPPAR